MVKFMPLKLALLFANLFILNIVLYIFCLFCNSMHLFCLSVSVIFNEIGYLLFRMPFFYLFFQLLFMVAGLSQSAAIDVMFWIFHSSGW